MTEQTIPEWAKKRARAMFATELERSNERNVETWKMGIPLRIVTPELDDQDRIAASLERAIAKWEARHGKPFRDAEPAAEENEQADEAVLGLVWNLLADEGERVLEGDR